MITDGSIADDIRKSLADMGTEADPCQIAELAEHMAFMAAALRDRKLEAAGMVHLRTFVPPGMEMQHVQDLWDDATDQNLGGEDPPLWNIELWPLCVDLWVPRKDQARAREMIERHLGAVRVEEARL